MYSHYREKPSQDWGVEGKKSIALIFCRRTETKPCKENKYGTTLCKSKEHMPQRAKISCSADNWGTEVYNAKHLQ